MIYRIPGNAFARAVISLTILVAVSEGLNGQSESDVVKTDIVKLIPGPFHFTVVRPGSPIDGFQLSAVKSIVERETDLYVGYQENAIRFRAGIASGVVLVLKTEHQIKFLEPLFVSVRFKPNAKYRGVVGYRVEPNGRLRPLDLINVNLGEGHASFATFEPVVMTWVYLD